MARVKSTGEPPIGICYLDPRDDFIFNPEQPTLDAVIERWVGREGKDERGNVIAFTAKSIRKRYSEERWEAQRQLFLRYVNQQKADAYGRKLAELGADEMMEADKRQRGLGRALQLVGRAAIHLSNDPRECRMEQDGRPIELSARDVAYLIKTGAEVERKALGMVQQAADIVYAEQFTNVVVQVVNKFVTDPDVKRSIGNEVYRALMEQHEQLEGFKK